eukprot:435266-Pyramimonas_sp.AAC.1
MSSDKEKGGGAYLSERRLRISGLLPVVMSARHAGVLSCLSEFPLLSRSSLLSFSFPSPSPPSGGGFKVAAGAAAPRAQLP